METNNRMNEITGNLKRDVKDLLSESANIVTGFFKRGLCTVRVVADKWKAFANSISGAVDTLMQPAFIAGPDAPSLSVLPDGEPTVTIVESKDRNFPVGKRMTLSEANEYVSQMDKRRYDSKSTPHAVKIKIDYTWGEVSDRYWLPLQIGSGQGGLLEQMEKHLAPYLSNPERLMQEFDFSSMDKDHQETMRAAFLPFLQENVKDLSNNLLPYFRNHCHITELKKQAEALIPGMGEGRQAQYKKSLDEKIFLLRQMVNSRELTQLPQQVRLRETPRQTTQDAPRRSAREIPPQSRPSVRERLQQLKAKQDAQAQPNKTRHVPSRPKAK